jgi:hypothetical protein
VRKILIGLILALVVVLVIFRQRLFLRDPIATVERNGMQVSGVRVYLNYFNDILVEDTGTNERYLVQARDGAPLVPGLPLHLTCLRGMACLTQRDYAPTIPLAGAGYDPQVVMTSAYVTFTDGAGSAVRVELR